MRAADWRALRALLRLALVVAAAECVACAGAVDGKQSATVPAAAAGSDAAATCSSTQPIALADAEVVVRRRCTSCHSPTGMAGEDYDWTNERSLVAHRRNVAAQLGGDSMPPAGYPRPTPEERRTLLCWAQSPAPAFQAAAEPP